METTTDALFPRLAATCAESRHAFDRVVGMTQARRHLLALVARHQELSHADIQRLTALDGATVTRLVKQFEADGILRRRLDPQDNRFTLVSATPRGQRSVSDLDAAHTRFQARLLAGIASDEQATTIRVLDALRTNIRTVLEEFAEREGVTP